MNETDPDKTVPTPPEGGPAGWGAVERAWAQGAGPEADPPEIPDVVDDAEALPAPEGDEGRDAVDDAADEGPPLPDREPAPPEPEPEVVLPPKPPTRRERAALKPHPVPPRRKRGLISTLVRWTFALALIFGIIGPIVVVAAYRFIPPPITYLMVQRMVEGRGFDRRWVPLRKISPTLVRAVIAAEDARFCEHQGFDFEAMKKALRNNERRPGKIRGGSTISQQTAKNIFLWPSRSYVRKGLEAWFTVLIEGLWGKPRIMEVYLNSIEWGPGVYGAEAAARRNFGVSAAKLSPAQAARLAAIVPKPLAWRAAKPGPYIKRRSGKIGAAAGTVRRDGLAGCVL